jgi:uncharacterized repeat protein (TIGR04076 family)
MSTKVIGKVIDVKGVCVAGFKVGDELDLTIPCIPEDFNDWKKKPKICPHLISTIFPQILILQSGGKLPWQKKENEIQVICPDPDNTVTIILKRIQK